MNSEAYGLGHNAYHDGKRLRHNPYKRFTEAWDEWRTGWLDERNDDPYWDKKRLKSHKQNKFQSCKKII